MHSALQLLGKDQRFGIVSTGPQWKQILGDAIHEHILGEQKAREVYAGTETCDLNAGELHGPGHEEQEVEKAIKAATRRLINAAKEDGKGEVGVVILGCAGMVGMDDWVKEVVPHHVRVVDGVVVGVGVLQGLVRCGF